MATAAYPAVATSERLAAERRMQRASRTINGPGWRQRLVPLAEHMGNHRLIRARSNRGAALDLLDLDTLHQALMCLPRHDPSEGYPVIALAVENAPADVVAAETGIDPAQQVAAARAAIAALALEYESVAFAGAMQERDLGAAVRATCAKTGGSTAPHNR
jgi:hypothetical protein